MDDARKNAIEFNAKGQELSAARQVSEAEAAYRQAMAADPSWSVPHYNLALLCKYAGRWIEALALNRRAIELNPDDEAAAWNLGIAATALGDWSTARHAWERCGITLPAGEGPIATDYGHVPIRLDPNGRAEVVWAKRIDPARARLVSIPFPESGHRYGDLVLHDGAAVGERRVGDKTVPVFNALALLEHSQFKTFVVWAPKASRSSVNSLAAIAEQELSFVEDWSSSVRYICARCSEGYAPPEHSHEGRELGETVQPALAARDSAHALLVGQRWAREGALGPVSVRLVLG